MGVRLYLLRHGQSPSTAESGVACDFDRPLSQLGRDDVRRAAQRLARSGANPAIILHSPLKRAAETAAEAAKILNPAQGVEAFAPLSNELAAPEVTAAIRRRADGMAEILAVGHQPQLGELSEFLAHAAFNLRPAGMIALELKNEGPASWLWACNPEELRG
jgi:phosphohistidine phosphatase